MSGQESGFDLAAGIQLHRQTRSSFKDMKMLSTADLAIVLDPMAYSGVTLAITFALIETLAHAGPEASEPRGHIRFP